MLESRSAAVVVVVDVVVVAEFLVGAYVSAVVAVASCYRPGCY